MSSEDRTLLVSFPKSGSNWVRYCIEHFSGKRTPGDKRTLLVTDGETVIDRTHFLDKRDRRLLLQHSRGGPARKPFAEKRRLLPQPIGDYLKRHAIGRVLRQRRVLLILRNPYELYARLGAEQPAALQGLFNNIAIFERCRRDKYLVHYEDLMADFGWMGRILDFIGIEYDLGGFDLEHHRRRSLELYAQAPDKPRTADDPTAAEHHSRNLSPEQRADLRRFGLEILGPDLYERHLGRYESP